MTLAGITGLPPLDAWTLGRAVVAAGGYAGALLAVGGVLFRHAFPALPVCERRELGRWVVAAAWLGIALACLHWPLQAAYLGGDRLAAAKDPALLRIVVEGAQGHRLGLVVAGLLSLLAGSAAARRHRPRVGRCLEALGLVLVPVAFLQVGHLRDDLLLSGLLLVHLSAVAFWLAALAPLHRLVGATDAGFAVRQLERFGRLGTGMVVVLLTSGGGLAWRLVGDPAKLIETAYGRVLLIKLALVIAVLSLAALNRWRLVPGLARGAPGTRRALRCQILAEGLLMALVLLVVALWRLVPPPAG